MPLHPVNPIVWLILTVLNLYYCAVWATFILSWLISFNIVNRYQPIVQKIDVALFRLTNPALRRIRRFMPNLGSIDISPIVLILIITFIQQTVLYYFAR